MPMATPKQNGPTINRQILSVEITALNSFGAHRNATKYKTVQMASNTENGAARLSEDICMGVSRPV
jgi:hypothetical protein